MNFRHKQTATISSFCPMDHFPTMIFPLQTLLGGIIIRRIFVKAPLCVRAVYIKWVRLDLHQHLFTSRQETKAGLFLNCPNENSYLNDGPGNLTGTFMSGKIPRKPRYNRLNSNFVAPQGCQRIFNTKIPQ